jgi:hypothetical protein
MRICNARANAAGMILPREGRDDGAYNVHQRDRIPVSLHQFARLMVVSKPSERIGGAVALCLEAW